jgi:regulator of sirC expression with transglutaminase-like and TPR domain
VGDFQSYIASGPKDPSDAYNGEALAYLRLKQYDKAVEAYTRYIQAQPGDVHARYNRAVAYVNLKEYDNAIADLDAYLTRKPDDTMAIRLRADAVRLRSSP